LLGDAPGTKTAAPMELTWGIIKKLWMLPASSPDARLTAGDFSVAQACRLPCHSSIP
jgi:hypothetical protein